jgi:hypothetical protein
MDRVKIQEIADEAGVSNAVLIEKAKELGYDVTASNSTVTVDKAGILVDYVINGIKPNINEGDDKVLKEDKNNKKELDKLGTKKQELQQYYNKVIEERDQLKIDKLKFEQYKKEELNSLKERLIKEEINHKDKLEEQKIKTITQLQEDFLKKIESEYNKVNTKLDDLTQKELKLVEWQQKVEQSEKIFTQEKELFESEKEKLLNLHKQELEKDKEIFINEQEEKKVKKLEETNKKIELLYKEREDKIEQKEAGFIQRDSDLKIKENEVVAKRKYLASQETSLYSQAKDKVDEEVKNYQDKLKHNSILIEQLKQEREELIEEKDLLEKFEDRDLPQELEEKRNEISRLTNLSEEAIKQKNDLKIQIDNDSKSNEEKLKKLYLENRDFRVEIEQVEQLKSENTILTEKLKEIDFHKSENQILQNRLDSMNQLFTQAKEKELRVEDIKREPYLERKLENEMNVTDEIKWLGSMEENMKEYGVEYPKRLLYSFHTALKSAEYSPLAVLSGVSGTGKSELPKLYSHFGGFNFLNEAVQPTWDSPESMLGYYNTIENKFDSYNILKFLLQTSQSKNKTEYGWNESMNMILLDEMNLSHIELYFAEFLSKFEQRRGAKDIHIDIKLGAGMNHPLPLERNVLWIGTMNEDETTKSLSDKVLDRSFSINFPRPEKLLSRAKLRNLDEIKEFEYLHKDTWNKWVQTKSLFADDKNEVLEKYREISNEINKELTPTGRAIGHRVWQSMEYYINNHPLVIQNIGDDDLLAKNVKLAFEEQLVQKIMPKLRGIETHGKEKESLMSIKDILNQSEFAITEDFELSMDNPYGQFIWNSANYLKED